MFGRITVPFDHFPAVYQRPRFGCPVIQGDHFEVLLCTGAVIR